MIYDINFSEHDLAELILLGLLLVSLIVFLIYYLFFFRKLAFFKSSTSKRSSYPPVSVVISAKNEYLNLLENLPFVLCQDYPNYEVVVVNDCSQDDSEELLKNFQLQYPHLKIISLNDSLTTFGGKKFPLSIGIKEAKNKILLLTDADCRPISSQWIKTVVQNYSQNNNTEIVVCYGKMYYHKKSFLNLFERFDTAHSAIQYLSAALLKFPYMGVGRNLSYVRTLFFKTGGMVSHYKVNSGDDDLFISEAATKENTNVCLDPDSFIFSEAKRNFNSWWHQKKRHLTTSNYYKLKHKIYLGIYNINIFIFPALAITLLCMTYNLAIVAAIIFLKITIQYLIFGKCLKKLKEKKLLLISPLLEIVFAIINPLLHISNTFNKQKKWK